MRMALLATSLGLAGCVSFPQPYEPLPTSGAQWQRRQDEIERRDAEQRRLCQMMNKDTDRYRRDCQRPGVSN